MYHGIHCSTRGRALPARTYHCHSACWRRCPLSRLDLQSHTLTAETLAGKGYSLVLNDLGPADQTEEAVRKLGAELMQAPADISIEQDVVKLAERTLSRFGRVDVLVNNAGISLISSAVDTSLELWRRVMDVNLTGPFLLSR